jgi:hypothetical protein
MARICIALFAISTLFPVAAGIYVTDDAPRWLGIADVLVAAILFLSAALLTSRNRNTVTDRDRVAALRASQIVAGILPVLLVLFFLLGDRINWKVLVIGLAWRGWLLLYTLPYLTAALRREGGEI